MDRPIRVLHLIDSLSVGGAERLLVGLADRIDREHFEIHVMCLHVLRNNALRPAFEQLNLPLTVLGAKRLVEPTLLPRIMRYVREHQIDIIHTHLISADLVGRIVGRLTNRPVISTLHSIPFQYNREKLLRRVLGRFTARHMTAMNVAVARVIERSFIHDWHIPADRITTIYNAVPMEAYLAIPEGDAAGRDGDAPLTITNIGSLSAPKGQDILLAAVQILFQQRPNTRLMIVGQGKLEHRLKELASALDVTDRVTFTGLRHDIPQVLAESDIFVLSSTWEGLPLTAVEAMAAGRPVILTDVGGNAELVQHGVQGLIVPPSDAPALAAAMRELVDDPARRRALGRAGRARVQHDFSMKNFTAQHENLYTTIYQAHHASKVARRASA